MKNYLHYLYMITKFSFYGFIIQCFLFTALLANEGNAQIKSMQEVKLNLNVENVSLVKALSAIEKETEFNFVYNEKELSKTETVNLIASNSSLFEVLEDLSRQAKVSFKQVNNNISVKLLESKEKRQSVVEVVLQSSTVTGQVSSSEEPGGVPGVNIIIKGSDQGTVTDISGKYSIEVRGEEAVLVFSSIGFITEEVVVGTKSVIDMTLVPDITALEEIVVIGYGTQKKSDLTGAVSQVNTEEMTKQAANDVTQMMQGRVAGVSVTSDGQPGATPSVRIRGISTFGLGTGSEPLYVVDGFPLPGGIRDINPNDIESMQILKDATAGAIYGNRAANGVVIITTKGGSKNKEFTVGFNAYYGFQTIPQRIPVLDRVGYQTTNTELLANAGQPPVPGNDPNSPDYINDVDTDWQDAGYKDGHIQNYNLDFSGGSEKTSYYLSLDFLENEGTLVGSGPDYSRYSFRVNTETQLGKFKFGENVYMMRSDEHPLFFTTSISLPGGRPSLVNDLLQAAPTIPVFDENREGGFGGADAVINQSITLNVPGINTLIDNSTSVNRILANVFGEYEFFEGFTYRLNLQYDHTDILDELFVPEYDLGYFFPNPVAQYQVGNRTSSSYLIENTFNYKKIVGKHDFNFLLGQSYQDFSSREVRTVGAGLEKPYIISLGSAANFSVSDNQQLATLFSYFGRVNYTYDDRYLLTFNIRRDGSSKFREDNRYEVFPSVGLAWKIHNDINLPAFISELKLRGGYGEVGNQEIGNYRYQSTINRGIPYEFAFGRNLGAATTILIDPAIQWETRTTRSIALDGVFFENSLEFTVEYYSNTSENVLLDLPIPLSAGSLSGLSTNAGSIQNSGFEFSARYRKTMGDFTMDIAPNFYTVNNEILDIGPLAFISGTGSRNEVGGSLGDHFGWKYDGIFQTQPEIDNHAFQSAGTAPGDIRFVDTDEDGTLDEADRQFLGSGMPTYYYGLNIVLGYKNFDFTIFGSGSGGNLINSNLYRGLMPTSSYTNWHEDILNRWTPENTNTDIPRVVWNDPNNNQRDSDRPGWLQSGDYFRINTISLGYSLPTTVLSKIKMKSLRLYATMQNVVTFSSYDGYNPDFQAGILNPGFDYGTYPRPRTTMFGLQLKF